MPDDDKPQHDCCYCADGKRVRVTADRRDPRFGQSQPCPECVMPYADYQVAASASEMGILPDQLRSTLMTFDGPESVKWARSWAMKWPPEKLFVLFEGEKGNGKTHLSVALLREVSARHNRHGLFCEMSELLYRLRNASARDSGTRTEEILAPLRAAPLLVLDDIGVGNWTPFAQEQLWLLFGFRYARRLPTICSANPEGLAQVDGRIRDRLMDVRLSEHVEFGGKNRRTG